MNNYVDIYRMAYEAGYMNGRIDETLGKEYDDRTPLTKRREAEEREKQVISRSENNEEEAA